MTLLVFLIIAKGIKVSGKVAMFTVIGPYVFLIILFIRISLLPGSLSGIKYMMVPDFKRLLDFGVWQTALNQSFYQNNFGFGTVMTFASFRSVRFPVKKSLRVLIIINVLSGILSALIVFGYIGFFSHTSGIAIEDLPLSGPSLVFITYPASLAMMPFPRFWLFLFFLTMILLGIDSQLALLETAAYALIDLRNRYKISRNEDLRGVNSNQRGRIQESESVRN